MFRCRLPAVWAKATRPRFVVTSARSQVQRKQQRLIKSCRSATTTKSSASLAGSIRFSTSRDVGHGHRGRGSGVRLPPSKPWHQDEGDGEGRSGRQHNGRNSRSWKTSFGAAPFTWKAVAFLCIGYSTGVSIMVKKCEVPKLVSRCNSLIAEASAEGAVDLIPLYALLALIYFSVSTVTFSALPQLLDAGVLETAMVGGTSSNQDVSALCREMLHVLSFNAPTAARMGRNPKIREDLVSAVRQRMDAAIDAVLALSAEHVDNIRVTDALAESGSPSQGSRDTVNERSLMDPVRDPRVLRLKRDLQEVGRSSVVQRVLGLSIWLGVLPPERGHGYTDHGFDGGKRAEGHLAPGMETARGIRTASQALASLRNVLGASRSSSKTHVVDNVGGRSLERRWPMTWLYGDRGNAHQFESEGSGGDGAAEWPVDEVLVHSILWLMDATSNILHRQLQLGMPSDDPELERKVKSSLEQLELARHDSDLVRRITSLHNCLMFARDLRLETAAVLHEISRNQQMVGLLARRTYLENICRVSFDAVLLDVGEMTFQTARNVVEEYKRLYPKVEFPKLDPNESYEEYESFEQRRVHRDEGLKEAPTAVLPEALGEEDQEDVCRVLRFLQIRTIIDHLPVPSITSNIWGVHPFAAIYLGGAFMWGVLRRTLHREADSLRTVRVAWFRRLLTKPLGGGMRAAAGAVVLTLFYGPKGWRSYLGHHSLDEVKGRRGTAAMSCARSAVDLGVLFTVLRFCPYSFLPAVLISDHHNRSAKW